MADESHNLSHLLIGMKMSLVCVIITGGSIWQAATGFIGNTVYMRVAYPIMGLVLAGVFGLFAYAMFNQRQLRKKEESAKATGDQ